jgi:hypothetical protein
MATVVATAPLPGWSEVRMQPERIPTIEIEAMAARHSRLPVLPVTSCQRM